MHYTIVTVAVSIAMMVSLPSVFASPSPIVTTTTIIRSCSLFPYRRCNLGVTTGKFSLSPNAERIQRYYDPIKLRRSYPANRALFISTCTFNKRPTSCSYTFAVRTKVHGKHAIPNSLFTSYAISGDDTDKTTSNIKPLVSQHILSETSIYNILHSSIKLLENHSIPEPEESVIHLLSHALNLDWETGYQRLRDVLKISSPFPSSIDNNKLIPFSQSILQLAQQTLTLEQQTFYQSLLERRLQYEPLQYILGQWDFHYLTGLTIRKPMLCPRPETEELVELVLADIDQLIKKKQNVKASGERRRIRILDVGCGTGAIGLSIAYRYPHVQVVALDVLQEAVELSNENAIKFLSGLVGDSSNAQEDVGSLYQAILCSAKDFTNNKSKQQKYEMNFDIVVSNPPYIPMSDMQDLSTDVVGYESRDALCGGDDGLNVVRDIVHRLPEWVASETVDEQRYCWMEVDDSHPTMLAQWLAPGSKESRSLGVEYCSTYKDFRGRDRFVKLSTISIRQDTGEMTSTSTAIHQEYDCEKDTIRVRIWRALASGEELSMAQLCNRVGMRNNRGDIISHLKHVEIQAKTIRNKSEEWRIRRGLMPSGTKKLRLKRRKGAKNEEYIKLVKI